MKYFYKQDRWLHILWSTYPVDIQNQNSNPVVSSQTVTDNHMDLVKLDWFINQPQHEWTKLVCKKQFITCILLVNIKKINNNKSIHTSEIKVYNYNWLI